MYRQGDVLIERIQEIPNGDLTEERLLIRGEGRNHGHYIQGEDVKVYENMELIAHKNDKFITHYLEIHTEASLDHLLIDSGHFTNEHDSIKLPPGKYKVIRQREYNPYTRAIKMIRD